MFWMWERQGEVYLQHFYSCTRGYQTATSTPFSHVLSTAPSVMNGSWCYSICTHRAALANRNNGELSSKLSCDVMSHHCWCGCWTDEKAARKLLTFRLFFSPWWSIERVTTRKLFREQWWGDKQPPENICKNQQYYASCFCKYASKPRSADCKVMIKLPYRVHTHTHMHMNERLQSAGRCNAE